MPSPLAQPAVSTPKRDHLLDTAYRLFYRDGYHAVGIGPILAEAKLAKMTLYHHFESKEELIVAVLERRSEEVRANVEAVLAKAGPAPKKRFLAFFDRYEKWFAGPTFNGCPFIRAVAEYPDFDSPVHQAVVRHKQRSIGTLQSLLADLGVAHPEILAQQITLLVEGAIVSVHTFRDPTALNRARSAALTLVKSATPE